MTLGDIVKKLKLKTVVEKNLDHVIRNVYTGDLLSDVMANGEEGSVFVTIQAHKNSIAVATLKDFPAIIICNGREIPEDMAAAGEEECVGIFQTDMDAFHVSGCLYNLF